MQVVRVEVESIQVGKQYRNPDPKSMRLPELVASLKAHGQIYPIQLTPQRELIDGFRRLSAAKELGWTHIDAILWDVSSSISGQVEIVRNHLALPATAVARLAVARLAECKAAARQRQLEGLKRGKAKAVREDRPGRSGDEGRALAEVAKEFGRGWSYKTLDRAIQVVRAADEDPDKYGELAERMDGRGRGSGVYAAWLRLERKKPRPPAGPLPALRLIRPGSQTVISPSEDLDNRILCADNLDVLRAAPDGYWHACVTDATFGIGFKYDGWTEPTGPDKHWHGRAGKNDGLKDRWELICRKVRPGGFVAIQQHYEYRRFFYDWFGEHDLFHACRHNLEYRNMWRITNAVSLWVIKYLPGGKPLSPKVRPEGVSSRNYWVGAWPGLYDPVRQFHPVPLPLGLCEWLIGAYTVDGGRVLDPYCGSGQVCVAARKLGRTFTGIDRSNRYCRYAAKAVEGVK